MMALERCQVVASEYISNLRRRVLYQRICRLCCDFTARWFALFAAVDRRLPEQRRNRQHRVPCRRLRWRPGARRRQLFPSKKVKLLGPGFRDQRLERWFIRVTGVVNRNCRNCFSPPGSHTFPSCDFTDVASAINVCQPSERAAEAIAGIGQFLE
jgi:hypothetical protein